MRKFQYRVRRDVDTPWSRWVEVEEHHYNALRESDTTQKRIV